jgi:hypothetical protein
MEAIEGPGVGESRDFGNRHRGGGQTGVKAQGRRDWHEGVREIQHAGEQAREQESGQGPSDSLRAVLQMVRRESDEGAGWGNDFDGIRSEVDFRRAMEREEERLRAGWDQRLTRAFSAVVMLFWNSRTLRLLR